VCCFGDFPILVWLVLCVRLFPKASWGQVQMKGKKAEETKKKHGKMESNGRGTLDELLAIEHNRKMGHRNKVLQDRSLTFLFENMKPG